MDPWVLHLAHLLYLALELERDMAPELGIQRMKGMFA
uniref:Uncharacterized protein n=1 Tax=Picea glauca TaxID=3330 RepID=A0A101M1S9_PICGL|nr:hypothetical protein ABT39_MTgene3881 [Picea glauca]